jgi:MFS family permease
MARTDNETGLLAVLLMGLFITNVDVAIVNVATPAMHEQLNASGSELQFVVSGYVLAYAMLLITGARLGAMYGYRRLFLIGLVVFTMASLGCGLAPNAAVLIVAPFGYLVLAVSYFAISLSLFSGHSGAIVLFVLLGFGGLGLGIGITANIRQMTALVPSRYAPDMSGLITTAAQTSGVIGIATFGTAYFGLVAHPGPQIASHGFAILTTGFAITALLATIAAYRSSHPSTANEPAVQPAITGAPPLVAVGES